MTSSLYVGQVSHTRLVPKHHHFDYRIFLFWLALDDLDSTIENTRGFSRHWLSPVRFRRADYLGDPVQPLAEAVRQRMSELSGKGLTGKVFLLGQCRLFGLYFSPVNFYFLQHPDGHFTHMLAEVSNTPWNERHHYLVNLAEQAPTDKAFHVSPFNPMDMTYHWRVSQPGDRLSLSLSCHRQQREFSASLHLQRQPMNSFSLWRVMVSIPAMTIKTVVGIYWQALKLYLKKVPVYDHPGK
ncbi:DUF1365 domain-containing protein [Aestuariibacter halophilus]|uniref:DUF1365 domain-containing protein n=1 Tax=Fluctibacter halophilus TaxID=226011 RepID=A0ABS8G2D5_9ALTE|nr:DUF1365 domain-containing protein [Aestuariibacter halophilus]MCC2614744.1 DUF1365 domain-containing protein [Aestuariibacter halophilus]